MSSSSIRRIAWIWLLVGLLVLSGGALLLVSHFVFGAPVYDKYSGKPTSDLSVLGYSAIFVSGGALFAFMGRALLRWSKPKPTAHELDEPGA